VLQRSGGGEREVVFALRVKPDPRTVDDLRAFGKSIRDEQDKIFADQSKGSPFAPMLADLKKIQAELESVSQQARAFQSLSVRGGDGAFVGATSSGSGRRRPPTPSSSPGLEGEEYKKRREAEMAADDAMVEKLMAGRKKEEAELADQMAKLNDIHNKGLADRQKSLDATLKDLEKKTTDHNRRQQAEARKADREESKRRQDEFEKVRNEQRASTQRTAAFANAMDARQQQQGQQGPDNRGDQAFGGAMGLLRGIAYSSSMRDRDSRAVLDKLLAVEGAISGLRGAKDMVGAAFPRLAPGLGAAAGLAGAAGAAIVGGGLGFNAIRESINGTVGGQNDAVAGAQAGYMTRFERATGGLSFAQNLLTHPLARTDDFSSEEGRRNRIFQPYISAAQSEKETERVEKMQGVRDELTGRRRIAGQIAADADRQRTTLAEQADAERDELDQLRSSSTLSSRQRFGRQQLATEGRSFEVQDEIGQARRRGDGAGVARGFSELDQSRRDLTSQRLRTEDDAFSGRRNSNTQSREDARAELRQREAARDRMGPGTPEAEQVRATERIAQLRAKLAELDKEHLRTEQEAARIKQQVIGESIRGAQQELSIRKQMIDQAKEQLQTAQQRFGELSPEEQGQRLNLVKRLQEADAKDAEAAKVESGAGDLDDGEMSPAERRREAQRLRDEANAVRQSLTVDELREARDLGVGSVTTSVNNELEQRGGRLREVTGRDERDVERLEETKQALEVQLKDDRELSVQIERDDNALVESIVPRIVAEMEARDKELEKRIADEVKARMQQAAQMPRSQLAQGAAAQRAAAAGGGR